MKAQSLIKQNLLDRYLALRRRTTELCQPLQIEDYVVQSIFDVSPPKWHLAHTTWFFETFILAKYKANYHSFDPQFHYLFNSYYHGVGEPFPREQRGFLSRPTVATINAYRNYVDTEMQELLEAATDTALQILQPLIILGIHHEQQHQELLLMDIKHNFSFDPAFPVYHDFKTPHIDAVPAIEFLSVAADIGEIGHQGDGFCFDNELPRHRQLLPSYAIASRLVTNSEYSEFITDGGYQQPQWWLSDGWECIQKNNWHAPLYWQKIENEWHQFSLSGLKKLSPHEPVSHVSFYEADAYARWRGYRLPTEIEWEHFVNQSGLVAAGNNFADNKYYQPLPAKTQKQPQQFFGDLWEWTASAYRPYPGFKTLPGALGEYNGKFMNNQMVLRGGCCATPESHIRASYRNFFQPDKRWQFSGIRLATDIT